MHSELIRENELLKKEIRVLHEAAELTAELVTQQFELTELEKERYQEVADNLEGFKRTLDQIGDCVFMFDPLNYIFDYANNIAFNHTGYGREELYKMSFSDFGAKFSGKKMAETFAYLKEHPEESLLFETTFTRKNGVEVPVEVFVQYIAPLSNQGRFFSIVRNISQRLLEEKEKEQMQAKMLHTQKMESVGELAAGIAHEINTPIQFIGSNLSFLQEAFADLNELIAIQRQLAESLRARADFAQELKAADDCINAIDLEYLQEEVPEAIKQASEGVERVSKLVAAMKDFSHPGAQDKEQTNLNQIIQTTLQISSNEWKYTTDIDLDLEADLPRIPCFHNDIGQVFLNLIMNATHSIKERLEKTPDSPKGRIVIKTAQNESEIIVSVRDNGLGIPECILSKIFDPFFTTKEVGKGTGQGLAIVRNVIINKHDGDIEVESTEGEGSTFVIHLPRLRH